MPNVKEKKPWTWILTCGTVFLLCVGLGACGGAGIRTDVRDGIEDDTLLDPVAARLSIAELFERGRTWYTATYEGRWGPHYRRIKRWPLEGYARGKECEHAAPYFRAAFLQEPLSQVGVISELRLADIAFCQENFVEAISRYEGFKSAHPSNPSVKSGYCDFQIVAARFAVLPKDHWYSPTPPVHKRDPQELQEVFDVLQDFLQHYDEATVKKFVESVIPADRTEARKAVMDSFLDWYGKAQAMADALRVRLVKYELFVAQFHLRQGQFSAAMARFHRARRISGVTLE